MTIYNSKIKVKKPTIFQKKYNVKHIFCHEKYATRVRGRTCSFDKKWAIMKEDLVKKSQV